MRISGLFIFVLTAFLIACGDAGTTNTASNTAANANSAPSNTEDPVAVTTPTPEATTNDAPTLKPVYRAYCTAMVKRDEAALRRVVSTDTLREWEAQMKEDGIKSLMEFLKDEEVSLEICDAKNEVIRGNEGVATITAKWAPNGNVKILFVKEGNDWKLTTRSPDIEAIKDTATSNSTAK